MIESYNNFTNDLIWMCRTYNMGQYTESDELMEQLKIRLDDLRRLPLNEIMDEYNGKE
jgi:hypothetical protein